MKKEIKKIFLVLIFYALSVGIFHNFEELWLTSNDLTTNTVSIVFSLCSFLCISVIFLSSNLVHENKIKKFTTSLILIRTIIAFILYLLNGSGLHILIKFLTMSEYVIDNEILICIYPLLSLIKKDDKLFAWRDILYSAFYYIGVFLTTILLDKAFRYLTISYNSYLFISAVFSLISFFIIRKVNIKLDKADNEDGINILKDLFKVVKKDKVSSVYFLFLVAGQISYRSLFGLSVILLVNGLNFSPVIASNLYLITGLISAGLGMLVIQKLTFKNDYINLSIKYLVRFIFFFLAFLINNSVIKIIAIIYPLIISQSYSHITDAPYINRFDGKFQMAFSNLREMVRFFGEAIGTFLCGIAIKYGIKINFLFATIFVIFQCAFSYYALYLRKKDINDRK